MIIVNSYLIQGDNLIVVCSGKTHILNKNTSPNFNDVLEAIKIGDWATVETKVNIGNAIKEFSEGNIVCEGGVIKYCGRPIDEAISKYVFSLMEHGLPYQPLLKFIENLYENPSNRSVSQLFTFLQKNDMPITEDGCFVAYKGVEADYMSQYCDEVTKEKVRYMVGDKPSMPRNLISDDPTMLCHRGLHACSLNYIINNWRCDHIMLVKINPKDVVCIPNDCDHTKMRVCHMEVIGEHEYHKTKQMTDTLSSSPLYGDYDGNDDEIDDDYDTEDTLYDRGYDDGVSDFKSTRSYNPEEDDDRYIDGYKDGWNDAMNED